MAGLNRTVCQRSYVCLHHGPCLNLADENNMCVEIIQTIRMGLSPNWGTPRIVALLWDSLQTRNKGKHLRVSPDFALGIVHHLLGRTDPDLTRFEELPLQSQKGKRTDPDSKNT